MDFGKLQVFKRLKKVGKIDFLTRSVLKDNSGKVLGRFREDFGSVSDGFWDDLEELGKLFTRIGQNNDYGDQGKVNEWMES